MSEETRNPEVGVVLLNMGGAANLEEIRVFLRGMFRDPAILPLPAPLRALIAFAISRARSLAMRAKYQKIGGGSPILEITRAQAEELQKALERDGIRAEVTVAMRYTPPYAEQALRSLSPQARRRIVALPLYPQFSLTTSSSSLRDLRETAARLGFAAPLEIESWYDDTGYLDDLAARIETALADAPDGTVVLFSAHGLPERQIRIGDPYRDQIEATVSEVAQRLGEVECRLAFQSKIGPARWIGPSTLDAARELGRERRPVLVVPIAFVSENIETLHELDVEVAGHARAHGVPWFGRLPTQNAGERFVRVLAGIVGRALRAS